MTYLLYVGFVPFVLLVETVNPIVDAFKRVRKQADEFSCSQMLAEVLLLILPFPDCLICRLVCIAINVLEDGICGVFFFLLFGSSG